MEDWVEGLQQLAAASLRPLDGKLAAAGLGSDVEVITDRWGVPHIYASSLDDLYFAQGYIHACERLWQIDFTRRLAQGRLSEILGEGVLPIDRFFRTLGLGRTAKSWMDSLDDDTVRIAGPYSEGFIAGAASLPAPIEYQILSLEPELKLNSGDVTNNVLSIALLMAFALSPNWDFELLRLWLTRALGPDRARELSPFVQAESSFSDSSKVYANLVANLTAAAGAAGKIPGVGSNNWVVSGAKSVTGKPLLANDPHLKIQMPGIWMEMHLCCPELDVAGATLPGTPGVILGHNRRIAWGFTNTQADVADLYLEKLSEDGLSYEYEGQMVPLEIINEPIKVRYEPEPRAHQVRATRHGPLLTSTLFGTINPEARENIGDALAFRWVHYDLVASLRSTEGLNKASNWDEFRAAAGLWTSPGQNMIYADVDGNIGYQFTGSVPVRSGHAGDVPAPGWTGKHEWTGMVPFDELPNDYNPAAGFVATANNRVIDSDYPHHLTNDWEPPYRIRRIVDLLTEKETLSIEDFKRIQNDSYSGIAEELLPFFLDIAPSANAAGVFSLVQGWDRHMQADSAGAAIFAVWVSKVAEALFSKHLGDELFPSYFGTRAWTTLWGFDVIRSILSGPDAWWLGGDGSHDSAARDKLIGSCLDEAVADLTTRLGPDPAAWRWGQLHRVVFRHPLALAMPPLDELMSAGPYEVAGGDDTINRGVFNPGEDYMDSATASYRQIIDLADFDRSLSVITSGNSGNPSSPHYRDQSELWAKGEYHPMPFSRAAVEKAASGRLILEGPQGSYSHDNPQDD